MTHGPAVNIAVEGDLDEVVLRKLLNNLQVDVNRVYGKKGKNNLKENVVRYNQAARFGKWIILVDLNNDAECPPPFIQSWLPSRNQNLQLRIAVRAVEAWLLADRNEIARFLKVPAHHVPAQPESEVNPKTTLISLARRSRSKAIREDIVPSMGSTARQGPAYVSRLSEFTEKHWDIRRASSCAQSLKRTVDSLTQWTAVVSR
jgi:hypothetical protein